MWRAGTGGVAEVTVAGWSANDFVPMAGPHWAGSVGATSSAEAKNWSWYGALMTSTDRACCVSWSNDDDEPDAALGAHVLRLVARRRPGRGGDAVGQRQRRVGVVLLVVAVGVERRHGGDGGRPGGRRRRRCRVDGGRDCTGRRIGRGDGVARGEHGRGGGGLAAAVLEVEPQQPTDEQGDHQQDRDHEHARLPAVRQAVRGRWIGAARNALGRRRLPCRAHRDRWPRVGRRGSPHRHASRAGHLARDGADHQRRGGSVRGRRRFRDGPTRCGGRCRSVRHGQRALDLVGRGATEAPAERDDR